MSKVRNSDEEVKVIATNNLLTDEEVLSLDTGSIETEMYEDIFTTKEAVLVSRSFKSIVEMLENENFQDLFSTLESLIKSIHTFVGVAKFTESTQMLKMLGHLEERLVDLKTIDLTSWQKEVEELYQLYILCLKLREIIIQNKSEKLFFENDKFVQLSEKLAS